MVEDEDQIKTIREPFPLNTFKKLKKIKGNRTWKTAIKEEFGIND